MEILCRLSYSGTFLRWAAGDRTPNLRYQRPALCHVELTPNGAATGCHPRLAVLTRDARSLEPAARLREALCARRIRNLELQRAPGPPGRHPHDGISSLVSEGGLEPPQPLPATSTSGWRVCLFRHTDKRHVISVEKLGGVASSEPSSGRP